MFDRKSDQQHQRSFPSFSPSDETHLLVYVTFITCGETDFWLRSGSCLGRSPLSQSQCEDALLWRLKRGGGSHRWLWPSFWICPLRSPDRSSAPFRPCCILLAASHHSIEETVFVLELLETQNLTYTEPWPDGVGLVGAPFILIISEVYCFIVQVSEIELASRFACFLTCWST